MPKPLHPHTHAVLAAARHLDAVAKVLGEGPKFMQTPEKERTKAKIGTEVFRALNQTDASIRKP